MGFGGFGMWEIILVFLVALLLFGAKRLPEIGTSLGKGIREFKSSVREIEGELKMPDERRAIGSGGSNLRTETVARTPAPAETVRGEGSPIEGTPAPEQKAP